MGRTVMYLGIDEGSTNDSPWEPHRGVLIPTGHAAWTDVRQRQ